VNVAYRIGLIVAVLLGCATPLLSQLSVQPGSTTPVVGKDTLCFSYHFVPGDTAYFLSEAIDSVIFPGKQILLKARTEETVFVCDSVTNDTIYHLRTWLRAAHEVQTTAGTTDTVERLIFPWIGRVTHLAVTRLGKRLRVTSDKPTVAATSPGGIFRPLTLPPLGDDCARQYQSWQYADTVFYTENAVPEAIAFTTSLYRALDFADSNMIRFRQLQYAMTSVGSYQPQQVAGLNFSVECVMNSYGKMTFHPGLMLPIHHAATSEQKLKMKRSGQQDESGKHLILMHTRLVELRSSDATRTMKRLPEALVRRPR
jgi:hypothetical protein